VSERCYPVSRNQCTRVSGCCDDGTRLYRPFTHDFPSCDSVSYTTPNIKGLLDKRRESFSQRFTKNQEEPILSCYCTVGQFENVKNGS